jgi:hypothetical protein
MVFLGEGLPWQVAPLATDSEEVKDSVHTIAAVGLTRPAARGMDGEESFKGIPLDTGQIVRACAFTISVKKFDFRHNN